MMKKSIIALSVLTVVLAGCDGASDQSKEPSKDQQQTESSIQQNAEPAANGDMSSDVSEPTGSAPAESAALPAHGDKLDWPGSYHGTLPGETGTEVKTDITLKKDKTFVMEQEVDGKEVTTTGKLSWNDDASKLILDDGKGKPMEFGIEKDTIFKLDAAGNRVKGEMAEQFDLDKK
ncbi:copper resistance protein NlpE [Vibrio palustris]|uniref:Lipoprotein involved with copper homeostasis and adhesion n=1 Tax=Vibrio palustris TaxID=1918946 RepID=A0A1R4B3D3_9VIBR|nr:copper resistance protein NlpE [Vibrio palustris]SJL83427.1 lipoprotein involved with copper homeostasis and adhesion [Vibrio palustris]